MEGGVGGIIFSRTVRPEILTQSCDNADLRILQIYSCISASTPNLLSSLQKWTLNIIEYEQMNILNLNWSKFILMVTLSSLLSSYPKNFSWAGKTGWVYYDTHWKKNYTEFTFDHLWSPWPSLWVCSHQTDCRCSLFHCYPTEQQCQIRTPL